MMAAESDMLFIKFLWQRKEPAEWVPLKIWDKVRSQTKTESVLALRTQVEAFYFFWLRLELRNYKMGCKGGEGGNLIDWLHHL